jgi:putative glutathione S-transferase
VVMDAELSGGEFARQESRFRDWVGPHPDTGHPGEHPPESGRYHLYVSLACPWCHRTAIARALAHIQQAVPVHYLAPFRDERGWAFTGERFEDGPGGEYTDSLNGWSFMSEAYSASDPAFQGRITVPVLWDAQSATIVNNESADLIRMMAERDSLGGLGTGAPLDLYPRGFRSEIDEINERV